MLFGPVERSFREVGRYHKGRAFTTRSLRGAQTDRSAAQQSRFLINK